MKQQSPKRPLPSPTPPHLLRSERAKGERNDTRESTDNASVREERTRAAGVAVIATDDAAGKASSGSNGAGEEARTARVGDGGVERLLAGEEDRVGEAGGIWGLGLVADVRGDDAASARLAQRVLGQRGLEHEEEDVVLRNRRRVRGHRHDRLRIRAAGKRRRDGARDVLGERSEGAGRLAGGGGDGGNAVVAAVILGADGSLEGRKGVENVIELDDILVRARAGQLIGARLVEAGERGTDGGVGAGRGGANGGKGRLDLRGGRGGRGSIDARRKGTSCGNERCSAAAEGAVVVEGIVVGCA